MFIVVLDRALVDSQLHYLGWVHTLQYQKDNLMLPHHILELNPSRLTWKITGLFFL